MLFTFASLNKMFNKKEMKSLIKKIPDFARQRADLLESVEFPTALTVNEGAYSLELSKLTSLCEALNEMVTRYKKIFPYKAGYEDFKNQLLPFIVDMPDEKKLEKDLKARWLSVKHVQIQLSEGMRLNRDKELIFLLDAYEFPTDLFNFTENLFNLIRRCHIPVGLKFSQLYNEKTNTFVLSEEVKSQTLKKHTITAKNKAQASLYHLRLQLCDAMNGLYSMGFKIGYNRPFLFRKLLDVAGGDNQGGVLFKVNPNKWPERVLPELKVVPGSIQDANEYDEEGKPKGEYEPISLKVNLDSIPHNIRITVPKIIIPSFSLRDPVGNLLPFEARDIVKDEKLLQEVIFSGGAVEYPDKDVADVA